MCIRGALETSQTCGGLKGMESKWPGRRIQAELPFMAHMLYNHCESGLKTGNKPDDLAAPPSRAFSRDHGTTPSTRTSLRTAVRYRTRPSQNYITVPWPSVECRWHRLHSSSAATALHGIPLRDPVPERSHRPWAS
jgi:hypothetical protein